MEQQGIYCKGINHCYFCTLSYAHRTIVAYTVLCLVILMLACSHCLPAVHQVSKVLRQQTSWSADRESAENINRPDIFLNNPQITRVCTLVHNVAGVVATRVQPSHTRGPNQNVYLEENHHERSNLNHRWSSADKGRQRYKPSLNNAKKHTHPQGHSAGNRWKGGAAREDRVLHTPGLPSRDTEIVIYLKGRGAREKVREGGERARETKKKRALAQNLLLFRHPTQAYGQRFLLFENDF